MTPAESTQVAVELAEMRGEIRTGFAELSGRLDLALQRTGQTERALDEHRDSLKRVEERVDVLEAKAEASASHGPRLSAVEKLVWVGAGLAAAGGTAGGWLISALVK
ncbi:hypothetical protein [Streptomyces roseicoloratus]|uniref:hypothetical protein n=1 Tax=Streptomyces roseicoloratus TaxID=2508722 RepID=UPI001009EFF7|nr:hypothetical protein [Streptomyces roseicoloratus]